MERSSSSALSAEQVVGRLAAATSSGSRRYFTLINVFPSFPTPQQCEGIENLESTLCVTSDKEMFPRLYFCFVLFLYLRPWLVPSALSFAGHEDRTQEGAVLGRTAQRDELVKEALAPVLRSPQSSAMGASFVSDISAGGW